MNTEIVELLPKLLSGIALLVLIPFAYKFAFALVSFVMQHLHPIKTLTIYYKVDGVQKKETEVSLEDSPQLIAVLRKILFAQARNKHG